MIISFIERLACYQKVRSQKMTLFGVYPELCSRLKGSCPIHKRMEG